MAIRSRSATSFSIRMPKNSSGPACARPSPWSPCAENSIGIWSGFLRDAYNELQPQAPCYVWYGWQSAVAMLGMGELRVLVKRAFDRGFIELHLLGFGDFEEDLNRHSPDSGRFRARITPLAGLSKGNRLRRGQKAIEAGGRRHRNAETRPICLYRGIPPP